GRGATDPQGQGQVAALRRGLEELGWSSGRNLEIAYRWHSGKVDEAATEAKELLDLHPDLMVANGTPSLAAIQRASSGIPIVFVAVADPVAQGFVRSLAQPGGMMTGFGAEEPSMGAKWVEMLREIAPGVQSVGIMFNPDAAPFVRMFFPSMEAVRPSSV